MAESIRLPDELVSAGNIAENWRKFKQEFELYLIATGLDTKTSRQKIALLLHVVRKQAIEVYNTFSFTEEEDGDFDSVIEKFNSYCNPKKNETYERYVFHSRKQLQGEPIEQFVTDLKLKAQTYGAPFSHLFTELKISPIEVHISAIELEISPIQLKISTIELQISPNRPI